MLVNLQPTGFSPAVTLVDGKTQQTSPPSPVSVEKEGSGYPSPSPNSDVFLPEDLLTLTRQAIEQREQQESTQRAQAENASKKEEEDERFERIAQAINEKLDESLRLKFGKHEGSGHAYFQLVDRSTGEIVKQYPPEELLRLFEQIKHVSGLFFSESA